MRERLLVVAWAMLAGLPAARAQVPPKPSPLQGVDIGARVAWAIPTGDAFAGQSLGGELNGALPLQLDLGYRFDRHFWAGFDLSFAPASLKSCGAAGSCSGRDTRVGLQVAYRLDRQGSLRPWLGLGVGYEWLHLDRSPAVPAFTLSGFEWVNLQLGGDFALNPRIWMGPFLTVALGGFTESDAGPVSSRVHAWIMLGWKTSFEL